MFLVTTSLMIKSISSPIMWWLNFFWSSQPWWPKNFNCQTYANRKTLNCHTIGDGMLLVTKLVMTKIIMSPIMWWPNFFDCQACNNWIFYHHRLYDHQKFFVIVGFLTTKTSLFLITHKPTPSNMKVPLT
jgi:hypothetical protein